MYKELTAQDVRSFLQVPNDYTVNTLITFGTHPKTGLLDIFETQLNLKASSYTREQIADRFFSEVNSFNTPNGRIWFDGVYGAAYASELVHVAALLGAKQIIHLGSFGALKNDIWAADILLPDKIFGEESTTRMYMRENLSSFFSPDPTLVSAMKSELGANSLSGSIISIQAMLAETKEDINQWQADGFVGVEMECASIFAVANHFSVPVAAALYAADNLATSTLVTDSTYEDSREQRIFSRDALFAAALSVALNKR